MIRKRSIIGAMAPARDEFQISDLVATTGVPRATIHHYVNYGLLPPPRKAAANRFIYDDRHLQGLKLIKLLRTRRNLPLEMIKEILPDLLELHGEEAFRPEMWDRAVGMHLREANPRAPEIRLLDAAIDA